MTILPLAVLAVAAVLVPVVALTDSGPESFVRERLGVGDGPPCVPRTADQPGWRDEPPLPEDRDEPRAVVLGGHIYLAGGIERILSYGEPSDVPGVDERVEVSSFHNFTRLDPRTGKYDELAPLPEPLNHIGMVSHDGAIYVVGGHGNLLGGAATKGELYRYSFSLNRWDPLPSMPTARGAASVAVLGDRIYVAGGMRRGRPVRTVEAFDISERRWLRLAGMPAAREHTATAVADGRLYVIGGRERRTDAVSTVFQYNPAHDRWGEVEPLQEPSGGLEAASIDGTIVAMGGGDDRGGTVTGAIQVRDPGSGQWRLDGEMRTPRHGFGLAVVGKRIFAIGGSPCALFAASDIVESFDARRVLR